MKKILVITFVLFCTECIAQSTISNTCIGIKTMDIPTGLRTPVLLDSNELTNFLDTEISCKQFSIEDHFVFVTFVLSTRGNLTNKVIYGKHSRLTTKVVSKILDYTFQLKWQTSFENKDGVDSIKERLISISINLEKRKLSKLQVVTEDYGEIIYSYSLFRQ